MNFRGYFPLLLCENEEISFFVQVVNMELEKRVADMETELKIVKGEIKELLVDIRDLVNRNENPFFNSQKNGVPRLETKGKGAEAENQRPADEEKNDKNKESAQEPVRTLFPDEVPEGNIPQQKTPTKEMQAIEPEISCVGWIMLSGQLGTATWKSCLTCIHLQDRFLKRPDMLSKILQTFPLKSLHVKIRLA